MKTQQRRADLRQMGQQTATVSVQCGLLAEQNLQQTILCATQWSNQIIWNRNNVPHPPNKTNIVLISLETKAVRHIHRIRNAYRRWMIRSIADRGLRRIGDEHRCKPQCFFFGREFPVDFTCLSFEVRLTSKLHTVIVIVSMSHHIRAIRQQHTVCIGVWTKEGDLSG